MAFELGGCNLENHSVPWLSGVLIAATTDGHHVHFIWRPVGARCAQIMSRDQEIMGEVSELLDLDADLTYGLVNLMLLTFSDESCSTWQWTWTSMTTGPLLWQHCLGQKRPRHRKELPSMELTLGFIVLCHGLRWTARTCRRGVTSRSCQAPTLYRTSIGAVVCLVNSLAHIVCDFGAIAVSFVSDDSTFVCLTS